MDDLQLFDLVEEVNQNFYDFLGVSKGASNNELRKAYRKLSLVLHPDKNPSKDAEEKFRQLVGVYEVLKDENKRKQYEQVLEFGLPDWKQPVFYYRKMRKMSLVEMTGLLTLIFTVGHYLVIWASYLEKKYEIEEIITNRFRKKLTKKKSKTASDAAGGQFTEEDLQTMIEEHALVNNVRRPRPLDLLPIAIARFTVRQCLSFIYYYKILISEQLQRGSKDGQSDDDDESVSQRRMRSVVHLEPDFEPKLATDVVPVVSSPVSRSDEASGENLPREVKKNEWNAADQALLVKGMVKFPPGTTQRWERIAEYLFRDVDDVTRQVKKLKKMEMPDSVSESQSQVYGLLQSSHNDSKLSRDHCQPSVSYSEQQVSQSHNQRQNQRSTQSDKSKSAAAIISSATASTTINGNINRSTNRSSTNATSLPSKACSTNSSSNTNNSAKLTKHSVNDGYAVGATSTAVAPPSSSNDLKTTTNVWSEEQQKCLEWALKNVSKDEKPDKRWTLIASHVNGKSKSECMERYKHLCTLVKRKNLASIR